MKAVLKRTSLKVKAYYHLKMVINTRDILKMDSIMAKGNMKLLNRDHIKDVLSMDCLMEKGSSNGRMISIIKVSIKKG
jgi:hypothetical protein